MVRLGLLRIIILVGQAVFSTGAAMLPPPAVSVLRVLKFFLHPRRPYS